jgi:hypothetical protein
MKTLSIESAFIDRVETVIVADGLICVDGNCNTFESKSYDVAWALLPESISHEVAWALLPEE